MLVFLLLRVELFITEHKLLLDPWVILMEGHLVALSFLEELAWRHFKHEVVIFLVVKHFQSEYSQSKVLFFWVFPDLLVVLRL